MGRLQLDAILKLVDVNINPSIFKKISAATALLPKNMQVFNQQFATTNNVTKQTTQNITKLGQATNQVAGSLNQANKFATTFLRRMAQFAVLLPVFVTLNKAIQGGVAFMTEFEKELTKVVRVNPKELKDRMTEIGESVLTIAKNFGATGDEVLGSVKTFVQAGDSIEEALDKAKIATLAVQVSTLDLVQAQELLIGVSRQFSDQGLSNADVLDKISKAEDVSAANAQDFADAFRTGGNALNFATKSFEDSIGLIAALREQTRKSGNEIGTIFKTISTRILAAGDSKKAIEALGISIENADGSLRPLLPILQDLRTAFSGLSEAEQASAAKAIAGVRQFEGLLGVLKSLDKAASVSAEALGAEGTAEERLTLTQQTLAFKVNEMVAAFQELAVAGGSAGLLDTFKKLVDFAGNIATALSGAVGFAGKLGVSLAPLLAIGAIKLGQSVFGSTSAGAIANQGLKNVGMNANQAASALAAFKQALQGGPKVIGGNANSQSSGSNKAIFGGILAAGLVLSSSLTKWADVLSASEDPIRKFQGSLLNASSDVVNIGTTVAVGFGSIQKGVLAGLATFGVELINMMSKLARDAQVAHEELKNQNKADISFGSLQQNKSGGLDKFVDIISQQLANSGGKVTGEFLQNVKREFSVFAKGVPELKNLDINRLFDPKLLTTIAASHEEFANLRTELEKNGVSTKAFSALLQDIDPSTKKVTLSMSELLDEADDLSSSLDSIKAFAKLADIERQIAKSRQELNDVSQQSITLFQSEIVLRQKEADALNNILDQRLFAVNQFKNAAVTNPGSAGFLTSDSANEFIDTIIKAFKEGKGKVSQILSSDKLSATQKKFGEELLDALKDELEAQTDLEKASFEIRKAKAKEDFDLQKGLKDAADDANKEILSLQEQLVDLGLAANTSHDDLEKLQNLTLDQFKSILDGTSNLPPQLQNAAQAGGGNDVAKAEQDIAATSAKASLEIQALNDELGETLNRLVDVKDGFNQVTGESTKDLLVKSASLKAAISQKEQARDIELAKLGIARAKAMKQAEDEALKKTQALEDALHKLAAAERAVGDKVRDIQKSFADFASSKISDFFSRDADAQSQLKEAEQGTLEATSRLADSYKDLNIAILQYNDALAKAQVESNVLGVQIGQLTGSITTFQGHLTGISNAFNTVLQDANISLQQRIELERQLSEETLSFLQQAQGEITNAGLNVFGQTGQENQALHEGIDGLRMIADKLGGSFQDFLKIKPDDFNKISNELLNLPVDFRQKISDALSSLPSTVSIGGFSVDQLKTAIGQVGAGVAPGEGLPSVEELVSKQTDELHKMQDLAIQDANLQLAGVAAAQQQVDIAKSELEEAKIAQDRAEDNVLEVRDAIINENDALLAAQETQQKLTEQLLAATTDAGINAVQAQAQEFADQNSLFRDIGDQIVQSIDALASVQSSLLAAQANIPASYAGSIPNYAFGSVTTREAAGLLRAASIEKRHMPAGAGLAVANTSEAIIPTRHKGYIPNFASGNIKSPISAGISEARGMNQAVVGAISRSISTAISQITKPDESDQNANKQIIDKLTKISEHLQSISSTNDTIRTNTDPSSGKQNASVAGKTAADLRIELVTNHSDSINVNGLQNLAGDVEKAIRNGKDKHVEETMKGVTEAVEAIHQTLRERNVISSFGKAR